MIFAYQTRLNISGSKKAANSTKEVIHMQSFEVIFAMQLRKYFVSLSTLMGK
jgi:hypothetical protein